MFGSDSIYYQEYDDPIRYPQFRFLNAKAYSLLCEQICDDILTGDSYEIDFPRIKNEERKIIKDYILESIITT